MYDLLSRPDWRDTLTLEPHSPLDWFVYYGDATALRAVEHAGADLSALDVDAQLCHAAFLGHWKVCNLLLSRGASPNARVSESGETALHGALAKAGRPYFIHVVRLLLDRGADVNAATVPGAPTDAFMRDVRTVGETPLHRAAAYADAATIALLIERGADPTARDAHGDSPLTWASRHLRPGSILALLAFEPHRIGPAHVDRSVSDHGAGWGTGMEWNLVGAYLPDDPS